MTNLAHLDSTMKTRSWLCALPIAFLVGCVRPGTQTSTPIAAPSPAPGVFFVATNGSDQWSGTMPAANGKKSDGPFATLPRALDAAREFKRQPGHSQPQPVTVFIRRGAYFLSEPLVLKPEDSDLALASYPRETPVLSGGRPIAGWREIAPDGRRVWVADIPQVRDGKWSFRELWVNGRRATRARHPNKGYFGVANLPDRAAEWTQGNSRFRFRPGDVQSWSTVSNAEVVVMNRWVESRLPIISVDEKECIISFGKRSVFELAAGDLYYLEGAFDFLDEPGEWYLDARNGTLYYMPRPGERLDQVSAIAPVLAQVLRFEGQPEAGQFVQRVVLRGLTFAHAEWHYPEGPHSAPSKPAAGSEPKLESGGFSQAAVGVPGAVWGEGLLDCIFENCAFSNVGNYGLELTRGCQRNRIIHCEFSDLGAGGLKIGEQGIRDRAAEQTRGNEITRCHIHDGGMMFPSGIGIWIGQSPDNRLTHNLIHDFYYTGISIGWTWGYGPALATNNTVEFNHVHHIGVKSDGDGPILSDMAGIYTLGKQPGTTVRNNLWHDIAGLRYGGWGIYFDEGSSGILAESNVVYRTTHGGFHQHYGETNTVRNNIFAFSRHAQVQRTRPEPHRSFSFETNIVYFDSGTLLSGDWTGDNYQIDWNLYFDARPAATPAAMRFGDATLDQWRARGHDLHSIITDPHFAAPKNNDFRLTKDSPALKIGFRPIDMRQVGP